MKAPNVQFHIQQPTVTTFQQVSRPVVDTSQSARTSAMLLGFWAAILTAILAATSFAVGVTTLPRSGPFCTGPCIGYPYTDVARFVPGDYLWMYPAILLAPVFLVLIACIHHYAPSDKKIYSQIGLSFALLSVVLIALDYFIQLAVMQPSLLKGETEGLILFSQYNPHGIFIALEDLGYLMMSLAFLFAAPALTGRTGLERVVRWLFALGSVGAIATLIALALIYGADLEYRFEVAVLSIDWTVLIVSGVLLSILFRRAGRNTKDEDSSIS